MRLNKCNIALIKKLFENHLNEDAILDFCY